MNFLNNLVLLKEDMKKKGWTICSFRFNYKSKEYIVLVKRFVKQEIRISEYALVKLHFINIITSDEYEIEANSKKLLIGDKKEFREYFGIEYSYNLGDIFQQFTKRLGNFIPNSIPNNYDEQEKIVMVSSLSKSDAENLNKIYCIGLRRNIKGSRSEYNEDKTKLLRPTLFQKFKNNKDISFCYSENVDREKTDIEILENLITIIHRNFLKYSK